MEKAICHDIGEDFGPCSCGGRSTCDVDIPQSWRHGNAPQEAKDMRFAMGYDYRGVPSACYECCVKAVQLGIAEWAEEPDEF
jgi:hypothetical protein